MLFCQRGIHLSLDDVSDLNAGVSFGRTEIKTREHVTAGRETPLDSRCNNGKQLRIQRQGQNDNQLSTETGNI